MPKGIPNKRYTPEFKKQVVEAVIQDGLSYQEAARIRLPEFMKFKDMTASKAGNGFIWKRGRKVLRWSVEGAEAQAGQRSSPAK